jgi:1,4-alpha-glucan branching enzyme
VAGGRYPSNRLTGMAAGRFLSAGLSLRLAPSAPALPRPAAAPPVPHGMTRLSITAPNAERVDIAGDFTGWSTTPARRAANGVWYVDLRLSPGEYRYAFRIDGKEWRVPAGVRTADDEFGGKSAWVTVHNAGTGRVVR